MDDEDPAAGFGDGADEVAHEAVALVGVQADAVLDRDLERAGLAHRAHARGHALRLGHQAGAEGATLYARARAAAVEVDLGVAPALGQPRGVGELGRLAATDLQRERVLGAAMVEVARDVAVAQRSGGDHLGVEPHVARQQPVQVPAVAVGPVEHRRDAQAPGLGRWGAGHALEAGVAAVDRVGAGAESGIVGQSRGCRAGM